MRHTEAPPPEGFESLLRFWDALPILRVAWRWPTLDLPLGNLHRQLRASLWRCACASAQACIGHGRQCAQPGHCHADHWIPLPGSSGGASWRMARLFLRHNAREGELLLWVLGDPDASAQTMLWTALKGCTGLRGLDLDTAWFQRASLSAISAALRPGVYALQIESPLIFRRRSGTARIDERGCFELVIDSLARRAQKFTALAAERVLRSDIDAAGVSAASQLLGFHARRAVAAVCASSLRLLQSQLHSSTQNGHSSKVSEPWGKIPELSIDGRFWVEAGAEALPMLGLLSLVGAGHLADEGHGIINLASA